MKNMDLIYPENYGEGMSGGEKEYRYERVISRMNRTGETPENFGWYTEMLKKGVPPSAGIGIGIERLTRYICGLNKIWEASMFPRIPGIISP